MLCKGDVGLVGLGTLIWGGHPGNRSPSEAVACHVPQHRAQGTEQEPKVMQESLWTAQSS